MKKAVGLSIMICGLCFLNACGSGSSAPPPPVATKFSIKASSASPTAGIAFNITVTALDASGAVFPGYSGPSRRSGHIASATKIIAEGYRDSRTSPSPPEASPPKYRLSCFEVQPGSIPGRAFNVVVCLLAL